MTKHRTEPAGVVHDFPGLDTLRAVGALAVLTTHTAFWAGDYTGNGWTGTLLARLDVGVAIFFVLSGFLLSRAWFLAAAHGRDRPSTGRYAWKRLLRIFPVYVVTVVIAYLFIELNQTRTPGQFVSTILLLDTYVDTQLPAGLTHMWSLAVEVAFYALLPLLMLLLVGRQPRWHPTRVAIGLLIGVAVAVLWWTVAASRLSESMDAMPLQWLSGFLSWFAIGIALAWLHVGGTTGRAGPMMNRTLGLLGRIANRPGALWVTALGLLLISATPLAGPSMIASPTPDQALVKNLIYSVVAGALVLPSVLGDPTSRYARLMANPVARHLGLISYSLFCIHLPVLHFIMWSTGWNLFEGRGLQIWASTLVVSLVAAELLYRAVELPAMRLRDVGRSRTPSRSSINTPTRATRTT